jgi:hypothetical protein
MPRTLDLDDGVRVMLDFALGKYEAQEQEDTLLSELSKKFQRDGCIADQRDFLEIVKWKARRALGRARENSSSLIQEKTRQAFEKTSRGQISEALDALAELHGVETRMATALLTFYDPNRFTVMDVNVWRSLVHLGVLKPFECWFEKSKDYPIYWQACQSVAEWYGRGLRNTDRALLQFAKDEIEKHRPPHEMT